jgi:hypothetical protein
VFTNSLYFDENLITNFKFIEITAFVWIPHNNFGPKCQKAARLFPLFDQAKRKAGRLGRDELIDKPAINNQPGKERVDVAHGSSVI